MELFVFITIFVLLAFYVAYGLRIVYQKQWLRVLLGPGILAANLARLLACQATFTPRVQTRLLERDGVKWETSPLPWAGPTLIATATFALPFALLFLLNHLLDYPLLFEESAHVQLLENAKLDEAFNGFENFLTFLLNLDDQALAAFKQIAGAVQRAGVANPIPVLMLYLSITVMLATAPTKRDLRYLLFGLLVMVVANRLFGLVGDPGEDVLSAGWFKSDPSTYKIWLLCTFLVSVLFGLFMIVVGLDVVRKVREVAMEPEATLPPGEAAAPPSARSRART